MVGKTLLICALILMSGPTCAFSRMPIPIPWCTEPLEITLLDAHAIQQGAALHVTNLRTGEICQPTPTQAGNIMHYARELSAQR